MITDPHIARYVHYVFEWGALGTGLWIYRCIREKKGFGGLLAPTSFGPIVGALLGAAIGNKLAFWVENPHLWHTHSGGLGFLLTGQSLVGALLGGWVGVEFGKRVAGVRARTGDDYVLPILCGVAIGPTAGDHR